MFRFPYNVLYSLYIIYANNSYMLPLDFSDIRGLTLWILYNTRSSGQCAPLPLRSCGGNIHHCFLPCRPIQFLFWSEEFIYFKVYKRIIYFLNIQRWTKSTRVSLYNSNNLYVFFTYLYLISYWKTRTLNKFWNFLPYLRW